MHWSPALRSGGRLLPRARVTLVARTAGDVQAVAAMIERAGGSAAAIAADLNDISALGPLIGDAVARWGGLDFLVHNAGGAAPTSFEATTAEALDAAQPGITTERDSRQSKADGANRRIFAGRRAVRGHGQCVQIDLFCVGDVIAAAGAV